MSKTQKTQRIIYRQVETGNYYKPTPLTFNGDYQYSEMYCRFNVTRSRTATLGR